MASKIFLYGKVPSGFFFIFWILVFALSKGKLTNEDKKPEIKLALNIRIYLLDSDLGCFLFEIVVFENLFLDLIIGSQHGQVKCHCSNNCGGCPSPKGKESFLSSDSFEGIDHILIVSPFCKWQSGISLHSDKGKISRISHQGTNESGGQCRVSFLEHR